MNILIINASPRPSGSVSILLDNARQTLSQRGDEVAVVNLIDKTINPCRGCMSCRATGQCRVFTDDSQLILAQMQRADAIIVGAPCYWANMPGTLKNLFDRIVYGLISESNGLLPSPLMKGKKAVILSVCNTPSPWHRLGRQTSATISSIRRIFKLAGIKTVATYQRGGIHAHPINDSDIAAFNRRLARL
jgi:multimeric flavodoxin WrbA